MSQHYTRLMSLFEAMTEGVILIAPDGQIVEANPAAELILGLKRSEITGRSYVSPDWRILRPDGTPMPAEEMAGPRAMSERRTIKDVVMGIERQDGTVAWISVSGSPLLNAGGELEGVVGTFADITERKLIEEALEYSERNYRTLVESLPQKVFLKDSDSVYISCNGRYAEDHNIEPEDIPGHTDYDFYPRDLAEKYIADDRRVMQSGETLRFEERYVEHGRERIVETFKTPVKDADSKTVGLLGIFHDITERKQAEAAREEAERSYRLLAENTTDVVAIFDLDLNLVWVSPSIEKQTGYTPDEMKKMPPLETMTPESIERVMEIYNRGKQRYEQGREVSDQFEMEAEVYRKDGSTFWVDIRYRLIRDDNGNPSYILMQGRDITEHRKADEALRESEERYRLMAENTSDCIWMMNPDMRITYQSPSTERVFGYTAEEWEAVGFRGWVHPDYIGEVVSTLKGLQAGDIRDSVTLTIQAQHKSGHFFWMEICASPIRNPDGRVAGIVGVSRDVTERKEAEEAVQSLKTQIEFILGATKTGLDIVDADFNLVYVDSEWQKALGDYKGRKCYEYFAGRLNPCPGCGVPRALETKQMVVSDQRLPKEGDRAIQVTTIPFVNEQGEWLAAEINVDVTERKEAEDRLLEYKTAVEQSADGIALVDLEGNIRFVNESWAGMHGYAVEELIGRHLSIFHTREQMESQVVPFIDILRDRGSNTGEVWHVRKNGEKFPSWMTTTLLKRADGEPFGMFALMRDITGQREMEEQQREREIAEARAEELSRSRSRLIEAQESLRKDIAGQLHGTVQNRLILLGHRLAELEARPASERTTEELAVIRHSLEELQREQIRPISHRLYPSILRLGIAAGLESLADTYRSQLPIDLQVTTNLREGEQANRKLVPDRVKLAFYRVAEEVLANVLKHASAVNSVAVKLTLSDGGTLRLTVSDEGPGFDTATPPNGIGLAIISDYAAAAGASCNVDSVPGKGTRVTAQVQLEATEARPRRKGRTSG